VYKCNIHSDATEREALGHAAPGTRRFPRQKACVI
jgi:hypothetical protein